MHAFQCSDSCYTARVCIRSAVKNPEKSSIHVPRLHQTLTQSKHRKPRVSAWTVQPQTLGTDSQGRTDAVSVTVPEDSVAELILHCSRTSALTRATRPNPLADVTPATWNEGGCQVVPRLPRKVARRPGAKSRPKGATQYHKWHACHAKRR